MENDKHKYDQVEKAMKHCIETLKNVEPLLDQISYEGESPFKKSAIKRKMEYLLIDLNEFIDKIYNRESNNIPKF